MKQHDGTKLLLRLRRQHYNVECQSRGTAISSKVSHWRRTQCFQDDDDGGGGGGCSSQQRRRGGRRDQVRRGRTTSPTDRGAVVALAYRRHCSLLHAGRQRLPAGFKVLNLRPGWRACSALDADQRRRIGGDDGGVKNGSALMAQRRWHADDWWVIHSLTGKPTARTHLNVCQHDDRLLARSLGTPTVARRSTIDYK